MSDNAMEQPSIEQPQAENTNDNNVEDNAPQLNVKILVVGDPHFKVGNSMETDRLFETTRQTIEMRKPDYVVVLGDTLHTHDRISLGPLHRAMQYLRMIADRATLILLIGNHDRRNNKIYMTDEHPFWALKGWRHTIVVDETTSFQCKGLTFTAVPYVPPGRFMEALGDELKRHPRAIFAHQEFRGVKMNAIHSTTGDVWDPSLPLVISGHIHDAQTLSRNLIYVGTPFQHAFGDAEPRGIAVFTFPVKGILKIRSEVNRAAIEFIRLPIPPKVIVDVSVSNLASFTPPTDVQLKIKVHGSPSEIVTFYQSHYPSMFANQNIKVQTVIEHVDVGEIQQSTDVDMNAKPSFESRLIAATAHDQLLTGILNEVMSNTPMM